MSAITGAMGEVLFWGHVNMDTIEKELDEVQNKIDDMMMARVNLEKSQISLNEKFAA